MGFYSPCIDTLEPTHESGEVGVKGEDVLPHRSTVEVHHTNAPYFPSYGTFISSSPAYVESTIQ